MDKNFIFIGYVDRIKYLKNNYTINLLDSIIVQFKNEPIKIYEVVF